VLAISNGASARSIKPPIKTRRADWRRAQKEHACQAGALSPACRSGVKYRVPSNFYAGGVVFFSLAATSAQRRISFL
jgi:hypothetical protein